MTLHHPKRVTVREWAGGAVGPVVGVDFETFYATGYSVSELGTWAYVNDRRFHAWAVSVSDGERTCVCAPAEFPWETIAGREWVSHNREFDEAVYGKLKDEGGSLKFGEGSAKWHCTAALCAFLQLPRDLAGAAREVFGLAVDKSARKRAKGRDSGPDLFGMTESDVAYAATDAEMALALWRELERHWPAYERRLFELTCEMGRLGVAVDWAYVQDNLAELNAMVEALGRALPWRPALSIPRFEEACAALGVAAPPSTSAKDAGFDVWLKAHGSSEAATWVRHMQRIRSANRTAKVLEGMQARRMPGDRMAYELKYFGAAPGRWSGGGGLNLQNMNRKEAEGVDLRRAVVAPPGYRLAILDYSQIESRVLLFLAGDTASLALYHENPDADAYEIHARATMLRTENGRRKTEEEWDCEQESLAAYCERTGSNLRQLAKARVLGLGFGCGVRTFVDVARAMAGLTIGEDESERIVREFRESNPKIVALWQKLDDACAACAGGDYALPLPCGQRYLFYRDIVLTPPTRARGRRGIECTVGGERVPVYGGLLAENWTQGTARDVLASAWLRCAEAGYRPVLSVHDELVFEVPAGDAPEHLARLTAIMEQPIAWAPGLPLRVSAKLRDAYEK